MKRLVRGAAVAAAVLVVTTGASASTGVVITSPAPGQEISRSAGTTIAVTGTADVAVPEQDETTWYLRRSTCGSGNDDARLSTQRGGAGEQSGCTLVAQPANEVFIANGEEGLAFLYPAEDGVPFTLDASRPITGTVRVQPTAGVGTTELELRGITVAKKAVSFGTWSRQYTATGAQNLAFSLEPPANLDKVDVASLELWVRTRGVVLTGAIDHRNGVSHLTVPTWSAGFTPTVEVALNSSTFSTPVKATWNADGTWRATVATPAPGAHTLYARLVQGALRSDASPVKFTVVP